MGIVAAIALAICCFTPILIILFIAGGLAAFKGYLDYILFPLLALSILLVIYAHQKCKNCEVNKK